MPDGSVRHVHVVAHATKSESGTVEFVGAVMDVTTAKQIEEKIRQQEMELRQILDFTPQHIGVLGPMEAQLYANHAALNILVSTSTDGDPKHLDMISLIQMIVNSFSAKERGDFARGIPMSSKLDCGGTTECFVNLPSVPPKSA